MGDASGSNGRVIEVINFLAAHPTNTFTLSELAKQLDLSIGSAHRVLTALTEARYLTRHPNHKTYSLGVALVAIGQAALEKHRSIDVARREMARLTTEVKAQCTAAAVVDDELLLLSKEGMSQTLEGLNRIGERRPFVPPLGIGHVAWSKPDVVDAFLAKAPKELDAHMRGYLRKAIKLVRKRGYAIAANGPHLRLLGETSSLPLDQKRDDAYRSRVYKLIASLSENEVQLFDIADAGTEGVCYISAPVFSPTGDVAMELTLSGMSINLSVEEIERYAERLRTAAAIVTRETYGRMPAELDAA